MRNRLDQRIWVRCLKNNLVITMIISYVCCGPGCGFWTKRQHVFLFLLFFVLFVFYVCLFVIFLGMISGPQHTLVRECISMHSYVVGRYIYECIYSRPTLLDSCLKLYTALWNIWTYQQLCKKNYTTCVQFYTNCVQFYTSCVIFLHNSW